MLEQRIWTHQEVIDILAALHAAADALPRPLRWLMRGWNRALACLGYALGLEAQRFEGAMLWTSDSLQGHLVAMAATRSGRAWVQALAAVGVALGLGSMPKQYDDTGEQVAQWLDSQQN